MTFLINCVLFCLISTTSATYSGENQVPKEYEKLPFQNRQEVAILSTIHGAHKKNIKYTYDSLFAYIDRYNPDVIGVEIRPEDMKASIQYLEVNYPYEMYTCIQRYSSKVLEGIDWLGADIEGIEIPDKYWQEINTIKKIQTQLNADSFMVDKLSVLNIVRDEKNKLALHSSLKDLNDGRYDLINTIYYSQMSHLLAHSRYQILTDFYAERDARIANNMVRVIRMHPGKRILFLVGADHRANAVRTVQNVFGDQVKISP